MFSPEWDSNPRPRTLTNSVLTTRPLIPDGGFWRLSEEINSKYSLLLESLKYCTLKLHMKNIN